MPSPSTPDTSRRLGISSSPPRPRRSGKRSPHPEHFCRSRNSSVHEPYAPRLVAAFRSSRSPSSYRDAHAWSYVLRLGRFGSLQMYGIGSVSPRVELEFDWIRDPVPGVRGDQACFLAEGLARRTWIMVWSAFLVFLTSKVSILENRSLSLLNP